METSLISAKGQVVIPVRLRKKYGFEPGKKIAFFEENGCIVLRLIDESFFSQYAGMLKETAPTKEEYQAWKEEEIEKEEQKLT
ncbi:AbrB/MazE/SpoVT family DNA-binding domain-containing protein [Mucilaginibacter arboris]|uniref:SpoVT-AbrB domain-containing protein n=1 Tax=Mucilaginibacter arboris TaxID=2682090 RepID=A0A7K1SZZ7_9SPHI|nr:AbrB/MazE/SpoVT family DNA-binding domain-containing protein [Mucilaginibacter arboris]MVN22827.1 hypothetical protein [Mucilaginibacter arboris]